MDSFDFRQVEESPDFLFWEDEMEFKKWYEEESKIEEIKGE